MPCGWWSYGLRLRCAQGRERKAMSFQRKDALKGAMKTFLGPAGPGADAGHLLPRTGEATAGPGTDAGHLLPRTGEAMTVTSHH